MYYSKQHAFCDFDEVAAIHSGGGIYIYCGLLQDGRAFTFDDCGVGVTLLSALPYEDDEEPDFSAFTLDEVVDFDALTSAEWQEEHAAGDLSEDDSRAFEISALRWLLDHGDPYQYDDLYRRCAALEGVTLLETYAE